MGSGCTRIERGHTAAGKIAISGGSAGGELMGAVVNSGPGLFGAVGEMAVDDVRVSSADKR